MGMGAVDQHVVEGNARLPLDRPRRGVEVVPLDHEDVARDHRHPRPVRRPFHDEGHRPELPLLSFLLVRDDASADRHGVLRLQRHRRRPHPQRLGGRRLRGERRERGQRDDAAENGEGYATQCRELTPCRVFRHAARRRWLDGMCCSPRRACEHGQARGRACPCHPTRRATQAKTTPTPWSWFTVWGGTDKAVRGLVRGRGSGRFLDPTPIRRAPNGLPGAFHADSEDGRFGTERGSRHAPWFTALCATPRIPRFRFPRRFAVSPRLRSSRAGPNRCEMSAPLKGLCHHGWTSRGRPRSVRTSATSRRPSALSENGPRSEWFEPQTSCSDPSRGNRTLWIRSHGGEAVSR